MSDLTDHLFSLIQAAIRELQDQQKPREIITVDLVSVKEIARCKGWPESKVRSKITRKAWVEGEHWFRSPDGDIEISIKGIEAWSKNKSIQRESPLSEEEFDSNLPGTKNDTGRTCKERRRKRKSTKRQSYMIDLKSRYD